ncbi:hypothetical protein CRV24_005707 [Beauveria bassiana]|nr:hypothetical protein CRV24_005707 [Beauveria bassiana]
MSDGHCCRRQSRSTLVRQMATASLGSGPPCLPKPQGKWTCTSLSTTSTAMKLPTTKSSLTSSPTCRLRFKATLIIAMSYHLPASLHQQVQPTTSGTLGPFISRWH